MGKTVDCNFKALEESALRNFGSEEYDEYIESCKKIAVELSEEIERASKYKKEFEELKKRMETDTKLRSKFSDLNSAIRYVPSCARDPSDVKLGKHQKNTGVFLWYNGYNPIEFLGKGANGVVWKCTKKDGKEFVAKVTCNQKFGPFKVDAVKSERNVNEELNKIVDSSETKDKSVKYLLTYENKTARNSGADSREIFESEYAKEGDLSNYAKKLKGKFSLSDIIRMTKQGAKGLKILHDAGYSHNDVKPENMLIIERIAQKMTGDKFESNCSGSSTNKSSIPDSKISEGDSDKALKIADFGAMTKIDDTKKVFANKHFCAPDCYKLSEEAVGKRDVYSLGLCALYFLFGGKSASYHKIAKDLTVKYKDNIESFIIDNSLNQKYGDDIILHKFLQVIQKMVKSDHNERIDIEKAVPELKELTNPQKNIGGV